MSVRLPWQKGDLAMLAFIDDLLRVSGVIFWCGFLGFAGLAAHWRWQDIKREKQGYGPRQIF